MSMARHFLKNISFLGVAVLVALFTCVSCKEKKVTELEEFHLNDETDIAMLKYVERFIEISPRDSGTVNNGKAGQWLAREIKRCGLKPQADSWIEHTINGKIAFSNIYTDYPGETDKTILIGCHYDTKTGIGDTFQGANDGGSTVGVMLELMRQMVENNVKTKHTIRFVFFDGEECFGEEYGINLQNGLFGSRRMAEYYFKETKDILQHVIIIDMVGDKNLTLEIPRNSTPVLAKYAMQASFDNMNAARVSLAPTYCIDDHWPFVERGFSAIDLIDYTYGSTPTSRDYWHSLEDSIDKISPQSLERTGILLVEILKKIDK